jgi:DNA-directed RNA polymerase I subunit RPA2
VLLKALAPSNAPDAHIYNKLVKGYFKNRQIGDCLEILLQDGEKLGLHSQEKCLTYLGSRFRPVLEGVTPDLSDAEVGLFLLDRVLFVHTRNTKDKFNTLCIMIEKLYSYVGGECESDSLDSTSNQEVLLGGHLYGQLLAEKLYDILLGARAKLTKEIAMAGKKGEALKIKDAAFVKKLLSSQTGIGKKMEHFLATGNLTSKSQLDLQ